MRIISLWLCSVLSSLLWCGQSWASEARETPLVKAVKRAELSVANIHSEKTAPEKEALLEGSTSRKINGMGTGIIVDEQGYIVTNQHVIADVDALRVTLSDRSTYNARVISYDRKHDLAIIKIDPTRPLHVMPLGTSSDLMLGETVIAIGNAFGYEHTVTAGIVSSLSRDVEVNEQQSYKNLLQTDASINPGNSGGPLLNLDGEVVGINVAIRAGAQRIGFAIPIDDARIYIARLLNTGRLNDTYHGLITRTIKGAMPLRAIVEHAEPSSPAYVAGFKSGDVVLEVGDIQVADQADIERAFLRHGSGEPVEVVVRRETERLPLRLMLTKAPSRSVAGGSHAPIIRANNAESVEEQSWRVLGMKLGRVPSSQLDGHRSRYRGGMKVLEVRNDGPAARNGIQRGDVLVGLHIWETTSTENITYILNHPKLLAYDPLKFYVLRGQETLYGHLKLK